jgi:hypothetical protein
MAQIYAKPPKLRQLLRHPSPRGRPSLQAAERDRTNSRADSLGDPARALRPHRVEQFIRAAQQIDA